MATGKTATPRDRLLAAATDLFYREGVTATGVERLCSVAGVSKRSMYQLFKTKDDLVAEALKASGPGTNAAFFPEDAETRPRERVLHVFRVLEDLAGQPAFAGCPFVNTASDLRDHDHPATVVAREFKQELTDWFTAEARAAGVADPELLGRQLTVVFDGSAARTVVHGTGLDGLSLATAAALLDAAGVA
ncbi:DNA-binding transcriptional regulator, AcrR family [Asanoa hainanensis]|uniref:DNA-binding transcriptional regulator, AcrR family n=1 Tax=Asanoa hainanensis TaxID=560556 RepID=A0A239K7F1_9ACTN|nr:TetR/AcrR family transcriptional regulator [Asanoa hainanensis]SNT13563.1 DNA-binding transcriptional regulator, AcrR family [Asanoa hainanensis]